MMDRAVWSFGITVERAMDAAEARVKGKGDLTAKKSAARQRALNSYLTKGSAREEAKAAPAAGRFRDPATSSRFPSRR